MPLLKRNISELLWERYIWRSTSTYLFPFVYLAGFLMMTVIQAMPHTHIINKFEEFNQFDFIHGIFQVIFLKSEIICFSSIHFIFIENVLFSFVQ